ncbi:hypothetical protein M1349_03745 [Patescibacteria group bacterium]|nr:hypothetical protein [Patescibacteria group bacterium]
MNKFGFIRDFFFSSYKRTISIVFLLAIAISVPVTLLMVQQQQEVRQHAAGSVCDVKLINPPPAGYKTSSAPFIHYKGAGNGDTIYPELKNCGDYWIKEWNYEKTQDGQYHVSGPCNLDGKDPNSCYKCPAGYPYAVCPPSADVVYACRGWHTSHFGFYPNVVNYIANGQERSFQSRFGTEIGKRIAWNYLMNVIKRQAVSFGDRPNDVDRAALAIFGHSWDQQLQEENTNGCSTVAWDFNVCENSGLCSKGGTCVSNAQSPAKSLPYPDYVCSKSQVIPPGGETPTGTAPSPTPTPGGKGGGGTYFNMNVLIDSNGDMWWQQCSAGGFCNGTWNKAGSAAIPNSSLKYKGFDAFNYNGKVNETFLAADGSKFFWRECPETTNIMTSSTGCGSWNTGNSNSTAYPVTGQLWGGYDAFTYKDKNGDGLLQAWVKQNNKVFYFRTCPITSSGINWAKCGNWTSGDTSKDPTLPGSKLYKAQGSNTFDNNVYRVKFDANGGHNFYTWICPKVNTGAGPNWSCTKGSGDAATGNFPGTKNYEAYGAFNYVGSNTCVQVITYAQNPQTGECKAFPTPCDVPSGWEKVNSCNKTGQTTFNIEVKLPGIGGNTQVGENPSPKNQTRSVVLSIFDSADKLVKKVPGTVKFDGTTYSYKGTVTVGSEVPAGSYTVKLNLDNTLVKRVPGIQTVGSGTVNLPTVTLIPGDLDGDNVLDLHDYNDFISCFGSKQCTEKKLADFNDDGVIDEIDLNILKIGLAVRNGD